jgi:hypothetical protein
MRTAIAIKIAANIRVSFSWKPASRFSGENNFYPSRARRGRNWFNGMLFSIFTGEDRPGKFNHGNIYFHC